MRFMKEGIGILLIIIFVISIEIITGKITNNSLKSLEGEISAIEERKNDDHLKELVDNLSETWDICEKKLSYYMEHDELEEISKIVTSMVFSVNNDENKEIWKEIDEMKFKVEHIKDKQKIKFENIF